MRELIVDVKKDNACFIDYIYNKISLPVKTVGGVCVLSSKNEWITKNSEGDSISSFLYNTYFCK